MKVIVFLLAIGAAVYFVNAQERQKRRAAREQIIQQHRVVLAMRQDEVRRSLGEPDAITRTPGGKVVWGYNSGKYVSFAGDCLIDSGLLTAAGVPYHETDGPPVVASAPAAQHSGHWVTSRDSSGTYHSRELPPGVSYMQSVGGGGGRVDPTPVPRTMLDRKAYR